MFQFYNFLTIIILIISGWFLPGCGPSVVHRYPEEEKFAKDNAIIEVEKVVSGDTIVLKDGRTIRYAGVLAPREDEPFFEQSRQANEWLIQKGRRRVFLEILGQESNGQYLAFVHTPTQLVYYCFINKELLEHGYVIAKVDHKIRYASEFLSLEDKARAQKKGLWATK